MLCEKLRHVTDHIVFSSLRIFPQMNVESLNLRWKLATIRHKWVFLCFCTVVCCCAPNSRCMYPSPISKCSLLCNNWHETLKRVTSRLIRSFIQCWFSSIVLKFWCLIDNRVASPSGLVSKNILYISSYLELSERCNTSMHTCKYWGLDLS